MRSFDRPQQAVRPTARGDEADLLLHLAVGEDLTVDPGSLEDAQNLVVDHRRARQLEWLARLVDRQHRDARAAEQQSEQLPDRPQPADQDVAVGLGALMLPPPSRCAARRCGRSGS